MVQVRGSKIRFTLLIIHGCTPGLPFTSQLVDGLLLIRSIVISAREVIPVVLLLAVLLSSAGKVESQPGGNLIRLGHLSVAIILVDFNGMRLLLLVCSSFVVQNCVPVEADSKFLGFGG